MSIYLFQSQNIQFIYSKGPHTYILKAILLATHSFKNIILNFENIYVIAALTMTLKRASFTSRVKYMIWHKVDT